MITSNAAQSSNHKKYRKNPTLWSYFCYMKWLRKDWYRKSNKTTDRGVTPSKTCRDWDQWWWVSVGILSRRRFSVFKYISILVLQNIAISDLVFSILTHHYPWHCNPRPGRCLSLMVVVSRTSDLKASSHTQVIWEQNFTLAQLCNKVLTGYNGMPHIYPQNCPFPFDDHHPIYYTHPSTDTTHLTKWHPNPINRFATIHFLDRQTDQQARSHDASRSQWQEYALKGCHLDIRAQIKKSRRQSMRMSMESIVPKYYQTRSRIVGRVGFGVTHCQCVRNRRNFAYFPSDTQSMGYRGSKKAYTGPRTGIYPPTKFGCDRSIVVGCRSRNDRQTSRQTDKQNEMTIRLTLCEHDATDRLKHGIGESSIPIPLTLYCTDKEQCTNKRAELVVRYIDSDQLTIHCAVSCTTI